MINNIKEVLVQQEGKTISSDEESYSEKQMLHFKILWWNKMRLTSLKKKIEDNSARIEGIWGRINFRDFGEDSISN